MLTAFRSGAVRLRACFIPASLTLLIVLSGGPVTRAQDPPPPAHADVTYLMPVLGDGNLSEELLYLREHVGQSRYVRTGFTSYIEIEMTDASLDPLNTEGIRAALASTFARIDSVVAGGRDNDGMPVGLYFITKIRERVDAVQTAMQLEDRRNMQWYMDNGLATGWVTHSRYARRFRALQEAYIREVGRYVATQMALYPDIVVAALGDGEVELAYSRSAVVCPLEKVDPACPETFAPEDSQLADYSPFAIAEFRDWLKKGGLYATEFPADEAYEHAARYAGDASPDEDTNGDGHTLNGDFGRSFASWELEYQNWSLAEEAGSRIPAATYTAPEWVPTEHPEVGFDAPRVRQDNDPWWQVWHSFRQHMIWRYNRDFANWMTTTLDAHGRTIPADRWFSSQIPTDYIFGNSPATPDLRFITSASSWWTADISPYGGTGVTSFNVNLGGAGINGPYAKTLATVGPRITAKNLRFALTEWNPSLPHSPAQQVYDDEMVLVLRYRPSLLIPFWWLKGGTLDMSGKETTWPVKGTPFVPALKKLIGMIDTPATCRVTGGPDTIAAAAAGTTSTFAVTVSTTTGAAASECAPWKAESSVPWITITPDTTTSGNGSVSYTVAPLETNQARTGRISIGMKEITVTQDPVALSWARPQIEMSAVLAAGGGSVLTPPQPVALSNGGTADWSLILSPGCPFITFTPPSGTGTRNIAVSIVPDSFQHLPQTYVNTCVITATSPQSTTAPQLQVRFTVHAAQQNKSPFGQVDSPAQSATGQAGAIGVTGWVLDDVGVASVKIYRNCLPFEPQENCQIVQGHSLVFVGDAAFLEGARPDVEEAFPGNPQAFRAGWGYLMMTSMLPHVPAELGYGGQGPLTLYVFATDIEGNVKLLGRSQDDSDPTQITMANDSIGKPFGAIDTPGQGEVVSGVVNNFGWALTPDTLENGTLIPTNGSTTTVFIDSLPVALVAYNQCRGSAPVGNPVNPGMFCDDDVSNIFGNATPQPVHTPRTANATRYRNLDAGRGAIGAHQIDTTTLTDGLHTIAWSVTDSAGRTEGIGSRFFIVANALGDERAAALRVEEPVDESMPVSLAPVWGRTGFDLGANLTPLEPDAWGRRHARIPELGRLELLIEGAERGALIVAGARRPLPAGSRLAEGRFAWAPLAGYIGGYELEFTGPNGRTVVDVTIATPRGAGVPAIDAFIDTPADDTVQPSAFVIGGWARDSRAWTGSGIGAVHLWAFRRDGGRTVPLFLGASLIGIDRSDVAAVHGEQYRRSGWEVATPPLDSGDYEVVAYFWSTHTGQFEDARSVRVTIR